MKNSYKGVIGKIEANYEKLPKNQKNIADYIINNIDSVPFKSVNELSIETDVSVASIVRFAQRIGYKGFLEMRDDISNSLKSRIEKKEIFSLFDGKNIDSDILTSVANQEISNINDTLNLIDRKSFDSAVSFILKSGRVFTAGLGISYLLSEILAYQLCQVAVDAENFKHSHSSFMEKVLYLNEKDLLIIFSFPPYSKETLETARMAKDKNISVISITNKNSAPAARYSDLTLVVKSENMLFTNSFSAISVLINAIATECALKNKKNANKILKKLNEIVEIQNLVITNGNNRQV